MSVRNRFVEAFYLDSRSLSLCRLLVTGLVIWDCIARYSAGWGSDILPLTVRNEISVVAVKIGFDFGSPKGFFLLPHYFCDDGTFQHFLLVTLFFAGLGTIIGSNIKFWLGACWLLTMSLHTRSPFILYGGDHVLRLLLFWLLFLPCGEHFTLTSKGRSSDVLSGRTVLSIGLVSQMLMIYAFTSLHKSGADWRIDGTAIENALSIQSLRTWLGGTVLSFCPSIFLKVCTHSALVLEEVGPLLVVLLPASNSMRSTIVGTMIAFHVSIGLLFHLCYFQAVMIAFWTAFLPPQFWQFLLRAKHVRSDPCSFELGTAKTTLDRCAKSRNVISCALVCYCLIWNIFTLPLPVGLPSAFLGPGYLLRIDQHWGLFAPNVQRVDGWLYAVGETLDGGSLAIDAYGDAPIPHLQNIGVQETVRSRFWREFHMTLYFERYHPAIAAYAKWINIQWNTHHPQRPLKNLNLYFMHRDSRYPSSAPQKVLMYPSQSVTPGGLSTFDPNLE